MFAHVNKTPPLIGSAQAAKKFGVDRATFNRWVAAGLVPIAAELDGPTGARLFDADLIDALVSERTQKEVSA
jgi:predicted site-specific integrase-resolvase